MSYKKENGNYVFGNNGNVGIGIFYHKDIKKAEVFLNYLFPDISIKNRIKIGEYGVQIISENNKKIIISKYDTVSRGYRFEKMYASDLIEKEFIGFLESLLIRDEKAEFFIE